MTTLPCLPVNFAPGSDLETLRAAFASIAPLSLGQAWNTEPEAALLPAEVRAGWQPDALCVLATLKDRDIFNTATQLNEETWLLGDVFEIFVKNEAEEEYFEFHITPDNQLLQLRLAHRDFLTELKTKNLPLSEAFINERVLETQVWVDQPGGQWTVFARVPFTLLKVTSPEGAKLKFSFCRYDYTRGDSEPCISSTSPHQVANFHRLDEWRLMELAR